MVSSPLLSDGTEGDTAKQVLTQNKGKCHNRNQEYGCARSHDAPVNEAHAELVRAQLAAVGRPDAALVLEPVGRNTAPAIALAALTPSSIRATSLKTSPGPNCAIETAAGPMDFVMATFPDKTKKTSRTTSPLKNMTNSMNASKISS